MKRVINGVEVDIGPEADLSEADLRGADLRWANLRWANPSGAKGNADTRLADGYVLRDGLIEKEQACVREVTE